MAVNDFDDTPVTLSLIITIETLIPVVLAGNKIFLDIGMKSVPLQEGE